VSRPRSLLLILATLIVAVACSIGAGSAAGGAGEHIGFELKATSVHPRAALFAGERKPTLRYRFDAAHPVDLKILVRDVRRDRTVASWTERDARPGARLKRSWNGVTRRGKAAKDGRYEFRVGVSGRSRSFAGRFRLHGHVFPVDGPHGTRGPIGDFGAPRSGGRVHEGFDITGACGTPLLVARGGEVAKTGYDPELYGNFVLINGRKTNEEYFYAHLIAPTPLREGEKVKTGARVGRIGQTGNAAGTPCHLHFELHRHGTPVDPEPHLRDWDAYS
jgi:murein DD-endopeptidase MepM/ murein hydrolase activator NlpD